MTITRAALRASIRAWAAEQDATVAALRRALQVVYGEGPAARTLDDIVEGMLHYVARRHEDSIGMALRDIDDVMLRLLDDVDAVRDAAVAGRPPTSRAADLRTLADAMAELVPFEDHVRGLADTNNPDAEALRNTLLDILGRVDDTVGQVVPALRHTRERGQGVLADAASIRRAADEGLTLERAGATRAVIPDPSHPGLQDGLEAMDAAVLAYQQAMTTPGLTADAAHTAYNELTQAVNTARELLRSHGRRFRPEVTLEPGTRAARAAADAAVAQRVAAAGSALDMASAADVFTMLRVSDLEVRASGTLGEPLSRSLGGLERYVRTPSQIGRLATDPPSLAQRLRDLFTPAPGRGWQRAHLVGPGFGDELFAGLMLAPWGVNQLAQNRGIESWLRTAATRLDEVPVDIRARGRRLAIPLADGSFAHVDVLDRVRYEISGVGGATFFFEIRVSPDSSWRVVHNLPPDAAALIPPHLLRGSL